MKKVLTGLFIFLFCYICFPGVNMAVELATAKEVVQKVTEAVKTAQEQGDEAVLKAVRDKQGAFVWKNAYLFAIAYDGTMLAHPFVPKLEGRNMMPIKDAKGTLFNAEAISMAKDNGQGWVEYWWAKPGEKKASQKASFVMGVPGKNYYVGGGLYDISKEEAEKASK